MDTESHNLTLEPYPEALYEAVVDAVPAWISKRIGEVSIALSGVVHPELELALSQLVSSVIAEVKKNLAVLLATDVDTQNINPLQVLRDSTSAVSEAMLKAGIPLPQRDQFEVRAMPNDIYSIGPITWRDLSEDVHDAGITWGAWKAAVILSRRRDEGMIPS
jgi:hypothetical protein